LPFAAVNHFCLFTITLTWDNLRCSAVFRGSLGRCLLFFVPWPHAEFEEVRSPSTGIPASAQCFTCGPRLPPPFRSYPEGPFFSAFFLHDPHLALVDFFWTVATPIVPPPSLAVYFSSLVNSRIPFLAFFNRLGLTVSFLWGASLPSSTCVGTPPPL